MVAVEPAKKSTRKPRTKKNAAVTAATTEKPSRNPRAPPRKKKVVPNYVIQSCADEGISYASVVRKVQSAVAMQDVSSSDYHRVKKA